MNKYDLTRDLQRHPGGWKKRWAVPFPRVYEALLILTGKVSLHRAWQRGYDQHIMDDAALRPRLIDFEEHPKP